MPYLLLIITVICKCYIYNTYIMHTLSLYQTSTKYLLHVSISYIVHYITLHIYYTYSQQSLCVICIMHIAILFCWHQLYASLDGLDFQAMELFCLLFQKKLWWFEPKCPTLSRRDPGIGKWSAAISQFYSLLMTSL